MKEDLTLIVVVLDRSGSMARIKTDTEGGYNTFIEEQKKCDGKAIMTLVQFDNHYDVMFNNKDINNVEPLILSPRGSTSLYDAVGRTINEIGISLSNMKEEKRPSKVIFVIITDGEENSSKEFNSGQIKNMIEHQRDIYKWQFVYIGANQDAFLEANKIGISGTSYKQYEATSEGTRKMFCYTSASVSGCRNMSASVYANNVALQNFFDTNHEHSVA